MAEHEQLDFEEEFQRLSRADPFVPFEIVTASGDRYEITEPLNVALGLTAVFVALPKSGTRYLRRYSIVASHVHESVA